MGIEPTQDGWEWLLCPDELRICEISLFEITQCVTNLIQYVQYMKAVDRVGSIFLRCILRRMKELGMTQTELARRMNASRPYVVKVLHGDVNITLASAARFAEALKLDFLPDLRDENGELYTVPEPAPLEA